MTKKHPNKVFLTAEWRKLVMANYAVDADILKPFIPVNTELDFWNDTCYVSLVGFMFINTKVRGIRIPFHSNFEEVNLRFYVRYKDGNEWKRGVVFIKEIVPRSMITFIANYLYKENYITLPMQHIWRVGNDKLFVEYSWMARERNFFSVTASATGEDLRVESKEEFITEHYWGYTQISEQHSSEYAVEHPSWRTYPVLDYSIQVNFGELYGNQFNFLSNEKPHTVFLAEGSEIVVRSGRKI